MIFKTINGELTAFNKTLITTKDHLKSLKTADIRGYWKYNNEGTNDNRIYLKNQLINPSKTVSTFTKLNNALKVYNGNLSKSTQLQNAYVQAVGKQNVTLGNYLAGLNGAKASLIGYIKYLVVAKASTIGLEAASIALNTAMSIGISIAISNLISQISKLIHSQEELRQKTEESANTYKETSSSISDYASRYKELREALMSAKGDEQETYNVKKQLLDLQTELNEKFGDEYGKLNLVTDAYKDQTEAIRAYNKEAANSFLNENAEGIKAAKDKMEKENKYLLSYSESSYTENGKALKEIAEKYKDQGIYLNETDDGQFTIHLEANPQHAYDTINTFESDLRDKANELGDEHLFDHVLDVSSGELNRAKETIDKYGDIYRQALSSEIAADDKKSEKYGEALQAVNDFNDAVLKSSDIYNDENVDKARQSLREIKEELSGEEWEQYGFIIDDVFDQADTRLLDFNEHINNDSSARKLAEDLEGLDDLDLKDFDENIGENTSFDKLKESAESYGLSVEELIDTLVRLGYVQGEISNQEQSPYALSIDEAKKAVNGTDNVIGLIEEYELLQEVLSDTGNIQEETYEKLISCSSKYATAVRTENGRITVNTSKLKAVAKSRQMDTKEKALIRQYFLSHFVE